MCTLPWRTQFIVLSLSGRTRTFFSIMYKAGPATTRIIATANCWNDFYVWSCPDFVGMLPLGEGRMRHATNEAGLRMCLSFANAFRMTTRRRMLYQGGSTPSESRLPGFAGDSVAFLCHRQGRPLLARFSLASIQAGTKRPAERSASSFFAQSGS